MDSSPSSSGENPMDQSPKKRLNKVHNLYKPDYANISPAATNQRKGEAITVARSCLGASTNSQVNSRTKNGIPLHGDCSPPQNAYPRQKSANSTMGINTNDQLKNSGNTELAKNCVLVGQSENAWYQNACIDEDNSLAPSILYMYQSIASILQSLILGSLTPPDARQNDNLHSGPIPPQPLIGNPSTSSNEHVCKVSTQSNMSIDHLDQLKCLVVHHLGRQNVLVNQLSQSQCQTTLAIQEIAS